MKPIRRRFSGVATIVLFFSINLTLHATDPFRLDVPRGLDLYVPVPEDNPLTAERGELRRKLFSDPILSRS